VSLRESCMRENCTYSLSGGRWPARKRATSDPTGQPCLQVETAAKARKAIAWVERILKEECDIAISSRPLEATALQIENIRMAYAARRPPGQTARLEHGYL
jgi:hypothetical protein